MLRKSDKNWKRSKGFQPRAEQNNDHTQAMHKKYNFVAPLNVIFHGLLWIIAYS